MDDERRADRVPDSHPRHVRRVAHVHSEQPCGAVALDVVVDDRDRQRVRVDGLNDATERAMARWRRHARPPGHSGPDCDCQENQKQDSCGPPHGDIHCPPQDRRQAGYRTGLSGVHAARCRAGACDNLSHPRRGRSADRPLRPQYDRDDACMRAAAGRRRGSFTARPGAGHRGVADEPMLVHPMSVPRGSRGACRQLLPRPSGPGGVQATQGSELVRPNRAFHALAQDRPADSARQRVRHRPDPADGPRRLPPLAVTAPQKLTPFLGRSAA